MINPSLYGKVPYDPIKDFDPVTIAATTPNLLVAHTSVPATSVNELIALIRAGKYRNFATPGAGTPSHLSGELFMAMTGVKLTHVPYRGSAPALQGLLAGDVDLMFDNLGVSLPLVVAGNLRLIAVASSRRLPSLPDVPTIAETLPGFEAVAWYAIVAPPNTPKGIVTKINADVNEALRQPESQDRLRKLSAETFGGSAEKAASYMREEVERWGGVIKAADIKLQ
jgi:tripartite-type tricarboxylate transporter receptor subunit TctC